MGVYQVKMKPGSYHLSLNNKPKDAIFITKKVP